MAATVADVRRIAPELADVSGADIEAFLSDAALELNAAVWGKLYDRAHALVAAHLTAQANASTVGTAAGPVASESVGPVSSSYSSMTGSASAGLWGTTRFGVEYQRLLRLLGPAVRVI